MIGSHAGLSQANALYRAGRYLEALAIYEQLALTPRWQQMVRVNIALCRRRLDGGIKLSVVVPVFKAGPSLLNCLQSILNQSEPSLELIVVHDGSSANSLDIIRRLKAQDSRVVLIHNDVSSGSQGIRRNQGIAIAKGAYLAFVDPTDWVEPDYFQSLLAVAEQGNFDLTFAAGYTEYRNGECKVFASNNQPMDDVHDALCGYYDSFVIWDKLYRTRLIKEYKVEFAETSSGVHMPFLLKAYYLFRRVGYAETTGYHYCREFSPLSAHSFKKTLSCAAELQAFDELDRWCRDANVAVQYQHLIQFRRVGRSIYLLRGIGLDDFHDLFNRVKLDLQAVDRNSIAALSRLLKKKWLFKAFIAITSGDAEAYLQDYRPLAVGSGTPGMLVFPNLAQVDPSRKLFYASLAQNFDIQIRGGTAEQLTQQMLDECKADFRYIHLHGLHELMDVSREDGADALLATLKYAQTLGYKIIYSPHDGCSYANESAQRELLLSKRLADCFDHVLVPGELAGQRLADEIGIDRAKVHGLPHGTYQGYYPNHTAKAAARRRLAIDQGVFVFLFFGTITASKGVDALLAAYKSLRSTAGDVALLIAGSVLDQECAAIIQAHASEDPSIVLNLAFVEENDVQFYFNAADLVVLPYRHVCTAGVALLSMAFERPIIAPRLGMLPHLIEAGGQGYLFDDHKQMLTLMVAALDQYRSSQKVWADQFKFRDLNAKLRWPVLSAQPLFRDIFSTTPKMEEYGQKRSPYRYALLRILGNDLPMRHSQDQTYINLKFTLEHEREFDDCMKLWVLNRIVDVEKKQQLIALLSEHGKGYVDIPYEPEVFARAGYCFADLPRDDWKLTREFKQQDERTQLIAESAILKHKNNYIINNNGARNRAFEEGAKYADWVFPWDGNCFVAEQAWASITAGLRQRPDLQYHIVPMERLLSNGDVLRHDYQPNPIEEPQIIFRKDAAIQFDESLMYGLRPKVQLLKRLGVPGVWDKWKRFYPWSGALDSKQGAYTNNYAWTGWTSRLFSGNEGQEVDARLRATMRSRAIVSFITSHDRACRFRQFQRSDLVFYDEHLLAAVRDGGEGIERGSYASTLAELESRARHYLANPLYSVVHKTSLPPSGDRHDYWHPAPYYWPDPASPDGLPYVHRDGERVPGTRLYEAESQNYDRTALQRVFDETTALALAGYVLSNSAFTERAAQLIRCWFIDEATAMNPHLAYAQVVMGRNGNRGTAAGLIESKDLYFFLDAVRLVRQSTFWRDHDEHTLLVWCQRFLAWLNSSDQGQKEVAAMNNHGVAFDLQTYALATFIGDEEQMYAILLRALSRLAGHFDQEGMQPHEMTRQTTAHYTAFNLHLWFNLSVLLRRTSGFNLFEEQRNYGGVTINPLEAATSWVLDRAAGEWPFKQIDAFDQERYQHLYHIGSRYSASIKVSYQGLTKGMADSKVLFFPHDGIAPFWMLQG